MNPILTRIRTQLETDDVNRENILEAIEELENRMSSQQMVNKSSRSEMIKFLMKNPFFEHTDFFECTNAFLSEFCDLVIAEQLYRNMGIQQHHNDEYKSNLL